MITKARIKQDNYELTMKVFSEDVVSKHKKIDTREMEDILRRLHRLETTMSRINLSYYTKATTRKDQQKWVRSKNEVRKIVEEELGFNVDFCEDPGVSSICIRLPSKRTNNNYDGETWRILW